MAGDYAGFNVDVNAIAREEAIVETIEELFDRVHKHIDESQNPEQARLLAVDSCVAGCLDILDMAYPARHNFPVEEIALVLGSWEPDPEPISCSVDTWIRGAIPETERYTPPQPVDTAKGIKDQLPGSMTGRMRASTASVTNLDLPEKVPRAAAGLRTASVSYPGMKKDGSQPGRADRSTQIAHSKAEERLREEIKLRKEQAALALQMARKDDEAREKLLAIQGQLRGKEYSYDHKGDIIVMNKLDPEKLPSLGGADVQLVVPGEVSTSDDAEGHKPVGRTASHTSPSGADRRGKSPKKSAAVDFVETTSKSQPPLLETLKVATGVTLRQGSKLKRGPAATGKSPGQMTRSEFAAMAASVRHSSTQAVAASTALGTSLRKNAASRESNPNKPPLPSVKPEQADARQSRASQSAPQPRPVTPDVTIALVNAPDWGSSGTGSGYAAPDAPKPTKPGGRMLKEEVGTSGFHPRNRNPVETARSGATSLPKPLAKLRE